MKPPDLLDALRPVVDTLEELQVRYYVTGSIASSAFGIARATADIDLVVDLPAQAVEAFASALEASYYLDRDSIRSAIQRRASFNLLHLATAIKVDIFVTQRRAFDRSVNLRAIRHSLSERDSAANFRLASAEDVILSKLEWFDLGGRVSERQWSDIQGILRVQGPALDLEYLGQWAESLGLRPLLDKALAEA